jgi:hypothetical protein
MKWIQTSFHSLRAFALGLSLATLLGVNVLAAPAASASSRHSASFHAKSHTIFARGGDGQESHGGGGGKGGGHRRLS